MNPTPKTLTSAALVEIADRAAVRFKGQFTELESAIGMLFIGRLFGWKVLYLVHSKATIRKYESILGESVRELFPEVGEYASKSVGFRLSQKFTSFWKLVNGSEPGFTKSAEIR